MSYLPQHFDSGDYATTIKVLDSMSEGLEGLQLASYLCNRALCYQRLDLQRKALKNYEDALRADAGFVRAHMGRGKSLQALGRPNEAKAAWQAAIDAFRPETDDLLVMQDAFRFMEDPERCTPARRQANAARPAAQPPQARTNGAPQQPQPRPVQGPPAPAKPTSQTSRVVARSRADNDKSVGLAVEHINNGEINTALSLLDEALTHAQGPERVGPLIARGTARALKRELDGAIEDFSEGLKLFPNFGDAWKRRGQARCAKDDTDGALQDFEKALELTSDDRGRAELRMERGMLFVKTRDFVRGQRELAMAAKLEQQNARLWLQLGVACMGLGNFEECCEAYRRGLKLQPDDADLWFHMAQARKEAAQVEEAEKAFSKGFKFAKPEQDYTAMWKAYAHMKQGLGQHVEATKVLTTALEKCTTVSGSVELGYLRGACYQALGWYKEAVEDFTRVVNSTLEAEENPPEEAQRSMALAYLQRELVFYTFNNLDVPVADFSLDQDIHPVWKAMMCKIRLTRHPAEVDSAPQPLPDPERVQTLMRVACRIGELVQNRHQGFLPNRRQQEMGGLAAIELAQAVLALVEARKKGEKVLAPLGASISNKVEHEFGWRDAMDIVVKWRQLSEPNDQVVWVDTLTKEAFEGGFGSHTPMFSGQSKCVRYYMNFHRALKVLKEILAKEGHAYNAKDQEVPLDTEVKRQAVQKASTAKEMWQAIGQDSWSVVPIASTIGSETLEGTRLTVVKIQGEPDHYEVSIRTPVTPPRWRLYDKELAAVWERLLDAFARSDKADTATQILTFCYYWYNFMPTARGTAVCGYITLLSLFAAAEMPIETAIPKNYQVDWEALLQRSPEDFIRSLYWLIPQEAKPLSLAPNESSADNGQTTVASEPQSNGVKTPYSVHNLPSVRDLLPTLRNRLEVLNGPNARRI